MQIIAIQITDTMSVASPTVEGGFAGLTWNKPSRIEGVLLPRLSER
jgi:hypothetical protein